MKRTDWSMVGIGEFWKLADELQERTVAHANELFTYAETASREDLLSLLIQYRFFTTYYIADLALLTARCQPGPLRSFLANVLDDELGRGDPGMAHPRLYDDFLCSMGAVREGLDDQALGDNIELLGVAREQLLDPNTSIAFAIGLRGMGGECVCQIYLSRFYEHIIRNPYLIENKDKIDWRFWKLHVGEHDIEHRETTRSLIHDDIVAQGACMVAELGAGYSESMTSWSRFWDNIFSSVKAGASRRVTAGSALDVTRIQAVPGRAGQIRQFHLAIPVRDMRASRRFYSEVLGAKEGRSTRNFTDFNFYGHHLVLHAAPDEHLFGTFTSQFHSETVKVPHFGMNFDWDTWGQLAERIKGQNFEFFDPPHIRMAGMPGEHATMFVIDPSGNALEFKAFRNHDEVFSKVFDPRTTDVFGLHELTARASQPISVG